MATAEVEEEVSEMSNRKFSGRSFVSYFSLYLFLILLISGIVLFVAPKGRYANWVGWTLLGLTKTQWEAVHTVSGYVFVIAILFHIKYNFNAIKAYIYSRTKKTLNRKWELILSTLISLLIVIGSVYEFPPVKFIMDTGESLKYSWEKKEDIPPVPHMELMTLREIADEIDISPEKVDSLLKSSGIRFNSISDTLKNVAEHNKLTPDSIYKILVDGNNTSENLKEKPHKITYGYGRMTLTDLVEYFEVEKDSLLRILKQLNISYRQDDNLRDIAEKSGLTPYELVNMMKDKLGR